MYILSKLFYFLLNPITWITILFIWALLTKIPSKRLKLLRVGVFTLFFFTFTPIFQLFAGLWEIPLTDIRQMKKNYDIGIVLGGYSDDSLEPNDRLHFISSATRLTTTIELYKKGIIKKILLTGGTFTPDESNLAESDKAARFLLTLDIPKEDIIIEQGSLNTYQNLAFSKKIVEKDYPNATCLLITSAWHIRRARACAKKVNLSCDTFSTDPFDGKLLTSFAYYIFPNTTVLESWRSMIKEWLGFTVYKVLGYI